MLLPKEYHIVLRQLEVILSVHIDLAELPLCYLWLEAEQLSAGRGGGEVLVSNCLYQDVTYSYVALGKLFNFLGPIPRSIK